jgi:hypothetical protein
MKETIHRMVKIERPDLEDGDKVILTDHVLGLRAEIGDTLTVRRKLRQRYNDEELWISEIVLEDQNGGRNCCFPFELNSFEKVEK